MMQNTRSGQLAGKVAQPMRLAREIEPPGLDHRARTEGELVEDVDGLAADRG